jgi:hypothetical protein
VADLNFSFSPELGVSLKMKGGWRGCAEGSTD